MQAQDAKAERETLFENFYLLLGSKPARAKCFEAPDFLGFENSLMDKEVSLRKAYVQKRCMVLKQPRNAVGSNERQGSETDFLQLDMLCVGMGRETVKI